MNKEEFLSKFNDFEDKEKVLASKDFKSLLNDTEDYKYDYEDENSVANFLNYKFLGKYDCDKIFGEIFGFEYTDTMNSFWTIFKQYIKICVPDEFELENGAIKKDYIDKYKDQYGSELSSQQLWIKHILNLSKSKNIIFHEKISHFSILTHTIGNFIEVTPGFNVGRYSNTLDYWDLTLLCIYKWYQTSSNFWLETLLDNNKEAIENTKKWLLSYDFENTGNLTPWEMFVSLNDLQSFVDEDFEPVELFKNHFNNFEKYIMDKQKFSSYFEKEKLLNPQTKEDLIECVTNINNSIIVRGENIADYEFTHIDDKDDEDEDDDQNVEITKTDFDNLIVTDKKDIDFPINADVVSYNQFYTMVTSDDGINVNKELFFDINLLDKELYEELKSSNISISFFRVTPMYVNEKILDWKV